MNPHESPTSTQPSPDGFARGVRIFFHHVEAGDFFGAFESLGHRRAVGDFGREDFVRRAGAGRKK